MIYVIKKFTQKPVEASNAFASSLHNDGADDAIDRAIAVVKPLVPRSVTHFIWSFCAESTINIPTVTICVLPSRPIACPYRAEYEHFNSYGFLTNGGLSFVEIANTMSNWHCSTSWIDTDYHDLKSH